MTTEADTCRNDILPKLYAADLENDPHSIAEQDVETRTPVILTSSQLLTTSIDERICCNVVLVRLANSMVKFRSSGAAPACSTITASSGSILDNTGPATRNFSGPAFDGDPAFASQEELTSTVKPGAPPC